jgi:hypothetical protein
MIELLEFRLTGVVESGLKEHGQSGSLIRLADLR